MSIFIADLEEVEDLDCHLVAIIIKIIITTNRMKKLRILEMIIVINTCVWDVAFAVAAVFLRYKKTIIPFAVAVAVVVKKMKRNEKKAMVRIRELEKNLPQSRLFSHRIRIEDPSSLQECFKSFSSMFSTSWEFFPTFRSISTSSAFPRRHQP